MNNRISMMLVALLLALGLASTISPTAKAANLAPVVYNDGGAPPPPHCPVYDPHNPACPGGHAVPDSQ